MWVIAEYEATALFTLKPATATASGGKTLLVPTPYAIKMALLDVACRTEGRAAGALAWESWLRDVKVALRPAAQLVVNNTFIKVLKPRRTPAEPGSQDAGHLMRTITYREYACMDGMFALALQVSVDEYADTLGRWLACINYLGKRGSFIQLQQLPQTVENLPDDFVVLNGQVEGFDLENVVLTQLDDVGEKLSFSRANIYSGERMTLGKERVLRHVPLPYRLVASSRSYSHYQRSDDEPDT